MIQNTCLEKLIQDVYMRTYGNEEKGLQTTEKDGNYRIGGFVSRFLLIHLSVR